MAATFKQQLLLSKQWSAKAKYVSNIQPAYPVDRPLVQISTIIYGVLYGLGSPHWIGHPAEQDQVAQERLVEGKGAHGVDTHATVDEFNDGIRVAAPYDPDLIVVVLELCTG